MKCALPIGLLLSAMVTVLLCAQCVSASPASSGDVNVTVEPYVSIWILDGPGDSHDIFPHDDLKRYPLHVTEAMIADGMEGFETNVQTEMEIFAVANCKSWIRVPSSLALTNGGTPYQATAFVTPVPISGSITAGTGLNKGFYFQSNGPISPARSALPILRATVGIRKAWTGADLAGYYWGHLFVDIQASGSTTIPLPATWPTHVEPPHH